MGFNRGCYTVDVRYFYRITCDAFIGMARPVEFVGLAVFDKRVILYGGEGGAKIFTSCDTPDHLERCPENTSAPVAVVESVDPIVLSIKLVECCDCRPCCCETADVPPAICQFFGSELCFCNEGKRAYVTLGQFSLIRLERDTQLLIPAYDYCVPQKECTCGGGHEEDPCELFRQIQFPMDEFFPTGDPKNCSPCCDDSCCPPKNCC